MSKEIKPKKSGVTPLDYSKVENWIINANADLNKDFDLIFFCGTSMKKTADINGVGDDFDQMRQMGYTNYMANGSQLIEDARVFCPIQRQIALEYALARCISHTDLCEYIGEREPYIDLEAALDYYFEHYNRNAERPFVLAGHSQGAAALQVCLNRYFIKTEKRDFLKNMIAAYSLGYGVSKDIFEEQICSTGLVHFAKGAGDFNCLISWNTEGVGEKGRSFLLDDKEYNTYVINPLNWKTDETYAGIDENEGVLIPEVQENGKTRYHLSLLNDQLCDAQIDLKRGSVICSTNKNYVSFPGIEGIWGGKSLHQLDGKGYYNNIKSNLRLRVNNFLTTKEAERSE